MDSTQVAVALTYERGGDRPPCVTAKGRRAVAAQILAVARASGVPIRRDAALAEILAGLDVGRTIPVIAFAAIAEILAYLYRLDAGSGDQP
jgi:flagellar biosynthesis protein